MQNVHAMRPEVRADYARACGWVDGDAAFERRFERFFTELRDPFVALYGSDPRGAAAWRALLAAVADAAAARAGELCALDHEREITPDWLQREQAVGYATYVDRFAGTLDGVRSHLDHLAELGVTYLHLMPLLRARLAPNDGGYAVADYGAVEPALGTMDDLVALADELRGRGIALCVDVVLNHTAREHAWAQAALAGDVEKLAFYRTFEDRSLPDAFEATLTEVFPDFAPGSFTWEPELGRWVWTTFNAWQWDLDWSNPHVLVAMVEVMLELANRGVDVLRLDAVPFLWKRLGGTGQGEPEVFELVQVLRAVLRIAAPGVALKAEAIVGPHELVRYLGTGRHEGNGCDLAYDNVLMVLLWSALASRRVGLLRHVLGSMPAIPPGAGWLTYVRCHDDIGWAVTEEDAAAVGESGHLHRRFLADFYAGEFEGSFARGAKFMAEPSGEARTSGTAASLAGLSLALARGDEDEVELALRRLLVLHAVVYAHGGIPVIWMGDELALRNDPSWDADPVRAPDNRWMHRPSMDWEAAARRGDPATIEGRMFGGLQRLAAARRASRAVHAQGATVPVATGNDHVLGLLRAHAGERLLLLASFSEALQPVPVGLGREHGVEVAPSAAEPDGRPLVVEDDVVMLAPYQHLWLRSTSR